MICTIFRERRAGGRQTLEPVASVTVPDTATDPESTAWTVWTRGGIPEQDTYFVTRQPKAFTTREQKTRSSVALGAVTLPA